MDNLGHRENGRQRPDQYKALHAQVCVIRHLVMQDFIFKHVPLSCDIQ
jgi:hypothetical protein